MRWCLALADGMPGDPPDTGDRVSASFGEPLRCPVCGYDLTQGVTEISTGITERRRLTRAQHGWRVREVDPECFGETWYECEACGAVLPAAIAERIAAAL